MTGIGDKFYGFPLASSILNFPPARHVVYGIPPTSETACERCDDGQSSANISGPYAKKKAVRLLVCLVVSLRLNPPTSLARIPG